MNLYEIRNEILEILNNKRDELHLGFEEENHIYTMCDLNKIERSNWPSVSKILKKFYTPFPTDEASSKKSKGDPILKAALIREWRNEGIKSANMGSRVHYILEDKCLKKFDIDKDVRQPSFDCEFTEIVRGDFMISAGESFIDTMIRRGAILLDTEVVMGDPTLGYTGQADKFWLIRNPKTDELGIIITDWKSNKPKNFETTRWTKNMLTPFEDLPDNALGHYYLQLPLYARLFFKMLEGSKYENIKLFTCIVVLIKDDGSFVEYKVPKEVISKVIDFNIKNYI